jgi:hypothetical protein
MKKIAFLFASFLATSAFAGWTANLGYNNPPGAIGLNFLYLATKWGFEAGIGRIHAGSTTDDASTTQDESSSSVGLTGDVNLKYFFSKGTFSPYLQGGVGAGIGASGSGVGAGLGGGFLGAGLLIGNEGFHIYGGVVGSSSIAGQLGVGMKL